MNQVIFLQIQHLLPFAPPSETPARTLVSKEYTTL